LRKLKKKEKEKLENETTTHNLTVFKSDLKHSPPINQNKRLGVFLTNGQSINNAGRRDQPIEVSEGLEKGKVGFMA
jgi:hypothetical protein